MHPTGHGTCTTIVTELLFVAPLSVVVNDAVLSTLWSPHWPLLYGPMIRVYVNVFVNGLGSDAVIEPEGGPVPAFATVQPAAGAFRPVQYDPAGTVSVTLTVSSVSVVGFVNATPTVLLVKSV